MERFNARSIIIIIAAFGLVAGSLFLLRKMGGGPASAVTAPAASGPLEVAGQAPPMELLGSAPAGDVVPASVAKSAPAVLTSVPAELPAAAQASAPLAASAPPAASAAVLAPHAAASSAASLPAPAHPPASAVIAAAPAMKSSPQTSSPKSAPAAVPAKPVAHSAPLSSSPVKSAPAVKSAAAPVKSAPATPKSAASPVHAAPAPAKSAAAPVISGKGIYYQCGAFKDPANAGKLLAQLKAAGIPAKIVEANGLKRVVAGPFSGPANEVRAKLQAAGVEKPFATKG